MFAIFVKYFYMLMIPKCYKAIKTSSDCDQQPTGIDNLLIWSKKLNLHINAFSQDRYARVTTEESAISVHTDLGIYSYKAT